MKEAATKSEQTHNPDSVEHVLIANEQLKNELANRLGLEGEELEKTEDAYIVDKSEHDIRKAKEDGVVTLKEQTEIDEDISMATIRTIDEIADNKMVTTPIERLAQDGFELDVTESTKQLEDRQYRNFSIRETVNKVIEAYQKRRGDKMAEKAVRMVNNGNTNKFQQQIRNGKMNVGDERIVQTYLQSINKETIATTPTSVFRALAMRGVPLERIAADERTTNIIIDNLTEKMNERLTNPYDDTGFSVTNLYYGCFPSSANKSTIDKQLLELIIQNPDHRQKISDSVDIQAYGDLAMEGSRYIINDTRFLDNSRSFNVQEREEIVRNINLLKQLGYEPFKSDEEIKFLCNSNQVSMQENLHALGIIEKSIVDHMYKYEWKQMKARAKNGGSGDRPQISANLEPSKENAMANYWREQSKALGFDAMTVLVDSVASIAQEQDVFGDDPQKLRASAEIYNDQDIQEKMAELREKCVLFDENGLPTDAMFNNTHPGFPLYIEYMSPDIAKFFANNLNRLHGEAKGILTLWDSLDGDTDAQRSLLKIAGKDFHDRQRLSTEIFNEDGTIPVLWSAGSINIAASLPEKVRENMQLSQGQKRTLRLADAGGIDWLESNTSMLAEDGSPTPEIFQQAFRNGLFDILDAWQSVEPINMSEKQQKVIDVYSRIEDFNIRSVFKEFIYKDFDNLPDKLLELAPQILNRLTNSNALEMSKYSQELARLLLYTEDPKKSLDKIENIYIRNNVPEFVKRFSILKTLHPRLSEGVAKDGIDTTRVSPVLASEKNPEPTLFSDLMKCGVRSGNRSLALYAETVRNGQQIFDKIDTNGFSALSADEQKTLDSVLTKLSVAHSHNDRQDIERGGYKPDLEGRYIALRSAFPKSSHRGLADQMISSVYHPLGVKNLDDIFKLMTEATERADRRGRESIERSADGKYRLKELPKQGDLVKGLAGPSNGDPFRYVDSLMNDGSLAQEFLGAAAGRDATPLDIDFGLIGQPIDGKNLAEIFDETMAANYRGLAIWVKHDDRFIETRSPKSYVKKINGETDSTVIPFSHTDKQHKYEMFATNAIEHYGIRTGLPSSEINAFLIDDNKMSEIYKAKNAITKQGFYVPIVNIQTEEVVFTPEEFDVLRSKMSGLSYYGAGDYKFAPNLSSPTIGKIAKTVEANEQQTTQKREAVIQKIGAALAGINLELKDFDGTLTTGAELIDTGSTGRGTNTYGAGDFDFMMRVDRSDFLNPNRMTEIRNAIGEALGGSTINGSDFRLEDVQIAGLDQPVDIDITFVQKTNKLEYSTEQALKDQLESIKQKSPDQYREVVANIMLAKQTLKAAGAYKPNRGKTPQGGLGGVGIENWVLQNGGSFETAARDFLAVAEGKTFEEFKQNYSVWDFGENHLALHNDRYPHDNFINTNMNSDGFDKMKNALHKFINSLK
jgi:hypothetical protein